MNAADSLQVGDPIVVIGKLRTQTWTTKDGETRESTVLEATVLAHDLSRGITRFSRVDRQQQTAGTNDATAAVLAELESQPAEGTAADSPAA